MVRVGILITRVTENEERRLKEDRRTPGVEDRRRQAFIAALREDN